MHGKGGRVHDTYQLDFLSNCHFRSGFCISIFHISFLIYSSANRLCSHYACHGPRTSFYPRDDDDHAQPEIKYGEMLMVVRQLFRNVKKVLILDFHSLNARFSRKLSEINIHVEILQMLTIHCKLSWIEWKHFIESYQFFEFNSTRFILQEDTRWSWPPLIRIIL